MWLGEQITEFGIGNGISIILFAGIVSAAPTWSCTMCRWRPQFWTALPARSRSVCFRVGVIADSSSVCWPSWFSSYSSPNAERRIPVQYAKRVVGRKMYGGQSSHIPLKVNMTGVMPIIFAQAIASLPATIAAFAGVSNDPRLLGRLPARLRHHQRFLLSWSISCSSWASAIFYSTMQFNPVEVANNLKKNGGFIPGFRPGKPTADFIHKVLNKITMFGALYLAIIAIAPIVTGAVIGVSSLAIGGTSIIIVVGVALETTKALEAQMLMRHYKGFLE
ncbi:MAG: preprotein translocase subunit SecY [Flavonifractor plautii]